MRTKITDFHIEMDGQMRNFSRHKGIDTRDDLELARMAVGIDADAAKVHEIIKGYSARNRATIFALAEIA